MLQVDGIWEARVMGMDFWINEVSLREGSEIRWVTSFKFGPLEFESRYLFSRIKSFVGLLLAGVFVLGFVSWLLLANRSTRQRKAETYAAP